MYIDSKGKATLMVTPLTLDEETGEVRLTEFKNVSEKEFYLKVGIIIAVFAIPAIYLLFFG